MPLPRILALVFAGAAAVPVLSSLIGFAGWLPDAAGVIALLVAAASVVVFVRRPVARWALAAGIVLLAGLSAVGRVFLGEPPVLLSIDSASRYVERQVDADYAGALLLLAAAVAITIGVVALPQFRRPVWQTALACVVALVPVAMTATDAAGIGDPPFTEPASAALWWHVAPGLAATVLAGLALVLAVSRAERWFLLPVGVLLVQITVADWTRAAAGAWTLTRYFGAAEWSAGSAFLEPGMRIEAPERFVPDFDVSNALTMAILLLGPALIAIGAARTAGTGAQER